MNERQSFLVSELGDFDLSERRLVGSYLAAVYVVGLYLLSAASATITVDFDGSEDYESISKAVDMANPNDLIEISSGVYKETVVVKKQLIFKGIDTGDGLPIIQASSDGSGFVLCADGVMVEDVVVMGSDDWPSAGILVNSNGCIIRNNTISSCGVGIGLNYSMNNSLINNTIVRGDVGIFLWNSFNDTIYHNRLSGNNASIYMVAALSNITFNEISHNRYGLISLAGSNDNLIKSNEISDNDDYGMYVKDTANCNFYINNISSNRKAGIYLRNCTDNSVAGNGIFENTEDGIYMEACRDNALEDNYVVDNKDNGITFYKCSYNRVDRNQVSSNRNNGISLSASSNNLVINNILTKNDYAISTADSQNNVFYLNNIFENENPYYSSFSKNSWNSTKFIDYVYKGQNLTGMLGNYWGKYEDGNERADGIMNLTYRIETDIDRYPLAVESSNYEILG